MTLEYILAEDGKTPLPASDSLSWAFWMQTAKRHVGDDKIGSSRISTVFLGLDHSFSLNSPPVLWETMVFGGPLDQEQRRYASHEDAVKGHMDMMLRVLEEEEKK